MLYQYIKVWRMGFKIHRARSVEGQMEQVTLCGLAVDSRWHILEGPDFTVETKKHGCRRCLKR